MVWQEKYLFKTYLYSIPYKYSETGLYCNWDIRCFSFNSKF